MKKLQIDNIRETINFVKSLNKLTIQEIHQNFDSKNQFLVETITKSNLLKYALTKSSSLNDDIIKIIDSKGYKSKEGKEGVKLESNLSPEDFYERLNNKFDQKILDEIIKSTISTSLRKLKPEQLQDFLDLFTKEIGAGHISLTQQITDALEKEEKFGDHAFEGLSNLLVELKKVGIPEDILEANLKFVTGRTIGDERINKIFRRNVIKVFDSLVQKYPYFASVFKLIEAYTIGKFTIPFTKKVITNRFVAAILRAAIGFEIVGPFLGTFLQLLTRDKTLLGFKDKIYPEDLEDTNYRKFLEILLLPKNKQLKNLIIAALDNGKAEYDAQNKRFLLLEDNQYIDLKSGPPYKIYDYNNQLVGGQITEQTTNKIVVDPKILDQDIRKIFDSLKPEINFHDLTEINKIVNKYEGRGALSDLLNAFYNSRYGWFSTKTHLKTVLEGLLRGWSGYKADWRGLNANYGVAQWTNTERALLLKIVNKLEKYSNNTTFIEEQLKSYWNQTPTDTITKVAPAPAPPVSNTETPKTNDDNEFWQKKAQQAQGQAQPQQQTRSKYTPLGEKACTARIQQALIDIGYQMPVSTSKYGQPDGVYGKETIAVVKKFQSENGVTPVSGIWAEKTAQKYYELTRKYICPCGVNCNQRNNQQTNTTNSESYKKLVKEYTESIATVSEFSKRPYRSGIPNLTNYLYRIINDTKNSSVLRSANSNELQTNLGNLEKSVLSLMQIPVGDVSNTGFNDTEKSNITTYLSTIQTSLTNIKDLLTTGRTFQNTVFTNVGLTRDDLKLRPQSN
jgi:peptidoglycan hydrolase-like protein with peptidoglycan-binding domain